MSNAVETATLTLLGAIVLFIISELVRGLVIGPILALRAHIGEVVDRVIFYAADLTSGTHIDSDRERLIREQLRTMSTQLRAKEQMLPLYSFWAFLGFVPGIHAVDTAARDLIGLSNSFEISPRRGEVNFDAAMRTFAADYLTNIKMIQSLQKALGLRMEIVPPEIEGKEA